jgi:hypothetical protein
LIFGYHEHRRLPALRIASGNRLQRPHIEQPLDRSLKRENVVIGVEPDDWGDSLPDPGRRELMLAPERFRSNLRFDLVDSPGSKVRRLSPRMLPPSYDPNVNSEADVIIVLAQGDVLDLEPVGTIDARSFR